MYQEEKRGQLFLFEDAIESTQIKWNAARLFHVPLLQGEITKNFIFFFFLNATPKPIGDRAHLYLNKSI